MDINERKILTLMNGLRKSEYTLRLNDHPTLTASVRVHQFSNGPRLGFTADYDGSECSLCYNNGLLKSEVGGIKFSISRFYFSLLREVNSEIRRLSDLIDNTL